MKPKRDSKEGGYVLIGVLIMTALTLLVTSGMLDFSASNAKTRAIVTTQAENYYEVEETLNRVVAWLQTNSKYLITAFNSANFSSNFDLGSPSTGANEGQHFSVPTMVKMAGTNDSVLLSNNSFFGVSAFPPTEHIDTSVSFDAVNEFSSANLGPANARVILIWARESDGNYEPIFRIDVVTASDDTKARVDVATASNDTPNVTPPDTNTST